MNTKLPPLPLDLNKPPATADAYGKRHHHRLEQDIENAVTDINRARTIPLTSSLPEDLESTCNELSKFLVAAAEKMVTEAQENLDQTKKWIEILRAEVLTRVEAHKALSERLSSFAKSVLDAHSKFNNGPTGGSKPNDAP